MVYEETVILQMPFDDVLERVKWAFAQAGFGTLTEIDLQHTLRTKVGSQMHRYVIVGACNPTLAAAALEIEPLIGVLLPCNVAVREIADGRVEVDVMDPGLMASMSDNEDLRPIADEARQLVNDALAHLTEPVEI